MNFPCLNCICVAVCRHKYYRDTVSDCALLCKVIDIEPKRIDTDLYTTVNIINQNTGSFRTILQSYLHPTKWEVDNIGVFVKGDLFRKNIL